MSSSKTTVTGILAILAAAIGVAQALTDGNPATNPDWAAVGAAVLAGIGLITARDNKVSDQAAGARPEPDKDK